MRIAIASASKGNKVSEHFGHCEHFKVYTVDKGQVINKESLTNPGHKPGFLPNFLNEQGVNVIISGGMGGGAIAIFNEKNIEVITGAEGEADTVVATYLKGKLKTTGSVCHKHEHHDECDSHK